MRKREKEKKAKEPKIPFYQEWYIDGRGRSLKEVLTSKISLAIIPLFLVIAYIATVRIIGNGAYGYNEAVYDDITKVLYDKIVEDSGPDVIGIREVAEYVLYDQEGNKKLVANKRNGYFNAEVTVDLSDNFKILKSSRNYDTQAEYINEYWLVFGVAIFIGGLLSWLIFVFLLWYILSVVASISKKRFEKANATENVTMTT